MAAVGEPAGEDLLVEGRRDLIADHPAQRHVPEFEPLAKMIRSGLTPQLSLPAIRRCA